MNLVALSMKSFKKKRIPISGISNHLTELVLEIRE
jgi:hypothetical protein